MTSPPAHPPGEPSPTTHIAITVATWTRPAMLAELLVSLQATVVPPATRLSVIVVDNDASGSARAVAEGARAALEWPLHYTVEPERNISLARNRGVALAIETGADYVAFIDDDETAAPNWLSALLQAVREHGADAATGPVVGRPVAGSPAWLGTSGLFTRDRRLPTGTAVPVAETANSIIATAVLSRVSGPFDAAYGITGGGDSEMFLRARLGGARIVWAAEAVVFETIPRSRARVRWLLQRAFRVGNGGVRVERDLLPLGQWLPMRVLKTAGHLATGLLLVLGGAIRGRAALTAGVCRISLAAGAAAGLAGFRYAEYARPR